MAVQIPAKLRCALCKDLMVQAVTINCCGTAFCYICIMNFSFENATGKCPKCRRKSLSTRKLSRAEDLKFSIKCFQHETGYVKKSVYRNGKVVKSCSHLEARQKVVTDEADSTDGGTTEQKQNLHETKTESAPEDAVIPAVSTNTQSQSVHDSGHSAAEKAAEDVADQSLDKPPETQPAAQNLNPCEVQSNVLQVPVGSEKTDDRSRQISFPPQTQNLNQITWSPTNLNFSRLETLPYNAPPATNLNTSLLATQPYKAPHTSSALQTYPYGTPTPTNPNSSLFATHPYNAPPLATFTLPPPHPYNTPPFSNPSFSLFGSHPSGAPPTPSLSSSRPETSSYSAPPTYNLNFLRFQSSPHNALPNTNLNFSRIQTYPYNVPPTNQNFPRFERPPHATPLMYPMQLFFDGPFGYLDPKFYQNE